MLICSQIKSALFWDIMQCRVVIS